MPGRLSSHGRDIPVGLFLDGDKKDGVDIFLDDCSCGVPALGELFLFILLTAADWYRRCGGGTSGPRRRRLVALESDRAVSHAGELTVLPMHNSFGRVKQRAHYAMWGCAGGRYAVEGVVPRSIIRPRAPKIAAKRLHISSRDYTLLRADRRALYDPHLALHNFGSCVPERARERIDTAI